MKEYGYTNYKLYVGEHLGNPEQERVRLFAEGMAADQPNCVIAERTEPRATSFGIPDEAFALLDGRVNMITKMPVRLCTLAALGLGNSSHFWDIGSCTGSVSIEARLRFPHLHVRAFEIRPEGKKLMQTNAQRFGVPGIDMVMGDFIETDLKDFESPDAVFIGGHGGRLKEILRLVSRVLEPGGCIVFNSVSSSSLALFEEGVAEVGMRCTKVHTITVDDHNPITIMKAIW